MYRNKFPNISSAYEECHAESVALYLSNDDVVFKIFGISDDEKEDAIYTLWLTMLRSALSSTVMGTSVLTKPILC